METFVFGVLMMSQMGKFVNVVVKRSPHIVNNVAQQIVFVMKPTRLVLREKSYQGIQNVMGNGAVGLVSSKSQFYKVALYLGLNETCI